MKNVLDLKTEHKVRNTTQTREDILNHYFRSHKLKDQITQVIASWPLEDQQQLLNFLNKSMTENNQKSTQQTINILIQQADKIFQQQQIQNKILQNEEFDDFSQATVIQVNDQNQDEFTDYKQPTQQNYDQYTYSKYEHKNDSIDYKNSIQPHQDEFSDYKQPQLNYPTQNKNSDEDNDFDEFYQEPPQNKVDNQHNNLLIGFGDYNLNTSNQNQTLEIQDTYTNKQHIRKLPVNKDEIKNKYDAFLELKEHIQNEIIVFEVPTYQKNDINYNEDDGFDEFESAVVVAEPFSNQQQVNLIDEVKVFVKQKEYLNGDQNINLNQHIQLNVNYQDLIENNKGKLQSKLQLSLQETISLDNIIDLTKQDFMENISQLDKLCRQQPQLNILGQFSLENQTNTYAQNPEIIQNQLNNILLLNDNYSELQHQHIQEDFEDQDEFQEYTQQPILCDNKYQINDYHPTIDQYNLDQPQQLQEEKTIIIQVKTIQESQLDKTPMESIIQNKNIYDAFDIFNDDMIQQTVIDTNYQNNYEESSVIVQEDIISLYTNINQDTTTNEEINPPQIQIPLIQENYQHNQFLNPINPENQVTNQLVNSKAIDDEFENQFVNTKAIDDEFENFQEYEQADLVQINEDSVIDIVHQQQDIEIDENYSKIGVHGNWRKEIDLPIGSESGCLRDFTQELIAYGLTEQALQVNMYAQTVGEILMLRDRKQMALMNEEYENLAKIRDSLKSLEVQALQMKEKLFKYREWIQNLQGTPISQVMKQVIGKLNHKDLKIQDLLRQPYQQTMHQQDLKKALENELNNAKIIRENMDKLGEHERVSIVENTQFQKYTRGLKEIVNMAVRLGIDINQYSIQNTIEDYSNEQLDFLMDSVIQPKLNKQELKVPICKISGIIIIDNLIQFQDQYYDHRMINLYLNKIKGL